MRGHNICYIESRYEISDKSIGSLVLFFFFQIDFMYIQSLRGILDLQETGVNETNFHEVI